MFLRSICLLQVLIDLGLISTTKIKEEKKVEGKSLVELEYRKKDTLTFIL